ncbi:VIT1/CCC1 transporter family protein [Cellulomonas cellasea]|uniref:Membrane protein n=2 Tax=Cellulomonas cellasea TaxID=43670 RepID=A0A0A0B924_9CELL|nr:VIT1/CCC1 transporter family protein [Cellulomonas cellasea]KGM01756.1 membrane protein [Cellulomonas cellasea DSM 20118]GEA89401.1 hypothetical protein CCE01nite_33500 [Cellulomonas cellasea]
MTTHPSPTVLPSLPVFDTEFASRLNWLRAGVLGANDGIVSIAAMVVGVAAATPSVPAIAIAGAAGLVAGALSMASGEYVSVSSQRDAERSRAGDDVPHLTSAWHAAGASLVSFVVGGLVPLLVVLTTPAPARVPATFAAVVVALALTGDVSARLGGSAPGPAVRRNVLGGGLAMAVTYGVGLLVGIAV